MTKFVRFIKIGGWVAAFMMFMGAEGCWAEPGRDVTVEGRLELVAAMGGETTGWRVKLEQALEVKKGTSVNEIEIDPGKEDADKWEGKKVQVSGALAWKTGVERGTYPVIVVKSIREK